MNYLFRSARVVGRIFGLVVGQNFETPVNEAIALYPGLTYYV